MQDNIKFEKSTPIVVKDEHIKGVLLHFEPYKSDGSVCDIQDLNKVGVDIVLKRSYGSPFTVFSGYLDSLLSALYAQTPKLQLAKKKRSNGYLIELDFGGMSLNLVGDDELEIRVNAAKTTFTSLYDSTSSISIETLISEHDETPIPQIRTYHVGAGKINFDEKLGENVAKVVFVQDFDNPYISSTKTKISSCRLTAIQETEGVDMPNKSFIKDLSENAYIVENINYLDMNPESDVQDLVIYQSDSLLDETKVKGKLSKAADENTQFLALSFHNA